jgi:lysophospholipase L1-like esterase
MELRMLSLKSVPGAYARTGVAIAMSAIAACGGARDKPASAPRSDLAVGPRAAVVPEASGESTPEHGQPGAPPAASAELAPDPSRSPADAVGATNASLSTESAPAVGAPRASLPSGTTVLHIGDSFAGALGIELNRQFKDAGVRGILKYETATYIPTWAWGKDLEKYLSKYHPDLVLITLGANELEIPDPAQRASTIRHLVERLAGRPCVWVAPPLWRGARPALLDVIRESCAPCAYLDSSEIVPELPRARDGIHPAMAARKAWAEAVIKWLGEHRKGGEEHPWRIE